MDHEPVEPVKISRRQALKSMGKAALVALLAGSLSPEKAKLPEVELNTSAVVLDFFNLEQSALPDTIPTTDVQAKELMMVAFNNRFGSHGLQVVETMQKTKEVFGFNENLADPQQVSVVGAVEVGEVRWDNIGNPTIDFSLSPQKLDHVVGQSTQDVVNLSLQVGKFSATYTINEQRLKYPEMANQGPSKISINGVSTYKDFHGNEITQEQYEAIRSRMDEVETVLLNPNERKPVYIDGYAGSSTFSNLLEMVEIARHHPKKQFVVAGGNPAYLNGMKIPDIREARAKIEKSGLWPENLIIVGFTVNPGVGGIEEVPASYGADIYVTSELLKKLGMPSASSFATPVISELIRLLIKNGHNTHDKIRKELFRLCSQKEYWSGQDRKEYLVLDSQKGV